MFSSLNQIFTEISISEIDSLRNIDKAKQVQGLFSIFAKAKNIFNIGKKNNIDEYKRTLKHILRMFKIYLNMRNNIEFHQNLSKQGQLQISEKVITFEKQYPNLIPIILMFHDIGRFFDRKNHPEESYRVIIRNKLLNEFKLSPLQDTLILKVIQYHLLFATIYTGESTFYAIYSLINDLVYNQFRHEKDFVDVFVDLLEVFTYIDVLGYSYATIYDHYITYYTKINKILKEILNNKHDDKVALTLALNHSKEWLEWRLAGGLRIFQFVETVPYLTPDFYYRKLIESKEAIEDLNIKKMDWQTLKNKYLMNSCKIQIKYGLGILMLLAFGEFFRNRMKPDRIVSHRLLNFWILLSNEVELRTKGNVSYPWTVYFMGQTHWSKWKKDNLDRLNNQNLEEIIKNATQELLEDKKEYILYLNFKPIFD